MRFTIPNIYINLGVKSLPFIKNQVKLTALRKLNLIKLGATELKLDTWCKKHYNQSLKHLCMYLIGSAKILNTSPTEFTILFKNNNLDRLARFITYGNGTIKGSLILKNIFYN